MKKNEKNILPSALTPEVCKEVIDLLAGHGFQFADYLDLISWIANGLRMEVISRSASNIKSSDPAEAASEESENIS